VTTEETFKENTCSAFFALRVEQLRRNRGMPYKDMAQFDGSSALTCEKS